MTMTQKQRKIARMTLDRRFNDMRPVQHFTPPKKGWIRAIRESLGMTRQQLAKRLDIKQQSLSRIESSEADGTVRLNTLNRAAEALDCTLVYALVPNTELEDRIGRKARAMALHDLKRVSHSMTLEDQGETNRDFERRIEDYIAENIRDKDLWKRK